MAKIVKMISLSTDLTDKVNATSNFSGLVEGLLRKYWDEQNLSKIYDSYNKRQLELEEERLKISMEAEAKMKEIEEQIKKEEINKIDNAHGEPTPTD